MHEYDSLLTGSGAVRFGTRNVVLDKTFVPGARATEPDKQRLYLREIREFHREYEWV
jgi:polyketide biosynthesis 3-hydroxy-3-methylglutaryl-CoA synthase-like enzyme PksG